MAIPKFVQRIIQWFAVYRSGLNSDTDPKDIKDGGLYLTIPESGALNVRAIGNGTNVSWDYEPILGNELVYQFAEPVVQNKIFRIDIVYAAGINYSFNVTDPSGLTESTGLISSGANLTGAYNNLVAAFTGLTSFTAVTGALTTVTATTGYFTVEITDVPYWDYQITSYGALNTVANFVTNGTFTGSPLPWTFGVDWSWAANIMTHTTPAGLSSLEQLVTGIPSGIQATIQFTLSGSTTGSLDASYGGTFIFAASGNGPHTLNFIPNIFGNNLLSFADSGFGYDGSIDNVIITVPQKLIVRATQEAIDPSMLGFWRCIGSDWKQGDLWQFWTTRFGLPSTIAIDTVTDNGAGVYLITTLTPHNLIQNQAVEISLTGTTADGIWIINIISLTSFELLGSVWASNSVIGTITTNIFGYGMITVAQKDENTQTWTGTVLLRSKEFNFSTLKQIDCRVKRKQDLNIAIYFTDNLNPYRVFYYKGLYITDGGLTLNGGHYDYGFIGREILLDSTLFGFYIRFISQIQTGGNIRSGNTRYAIRFGTETALSFTNWSFLSNPVPAGEGDENGTIATLFGNGAGVPTAKQNILEITNPVPGLFKYVEIAAVNYLDMGFTGEVIGRYVLTGAATQTIVHTGFELNVTDLDVGSLNLQTFSVKHGRNIELINNRAVKSNLTLDSIVDLSTWFAGFSWSLGFDLLEPYGLYTPGTGSSGANLPTGQYQLSDNVYRQTGHMLNERYRYFGIAEFTNGSFSPAYFIRDVIFDNTVQPGSVTVLTNFDLSVGNAAKTFYVDFHGFDINDIVDGVRVGDVVANIYIMRCELPNTRVKAGGIIIPAVSGAVSAGGSFEFHWSPPAGGYPARTGEFPFPAGLDASFLGIQDYFYGSGAGTTNYVVDRTRAAFYSWDLTSGNKAISPQIGFDFILNLGQPQLNKQNWPDANFNDFTTEGLGAGATNPLLNPLNIAAAVFIDAGTESTVNGTIYSKRLEFVNVATLRYYQAPSGWVVYTDTAGGFLEQTAFTDTGYSNGNQDRALYMSQWISPITALAQYGDIVDNKVVWTGVRIPIDANTAVPYAPGTTKVFGGDTFTQKIWFKDRYPESSDATLFNRGLGQGFGIYGQHRANFDFRANAGNGTFPSNTPAPIVTPQDWLSRTPADCIRPPDELYYNEGYTIRNQVQYYATFDPLAEYQTDWGNVLWWSQPEAEGSVTDNLRIFMPFDIKFEDYTFGYITEAKNENEELVVIQQRKTIREYFNSAAILTTVEGSELITGDGGVMNQKGLTVSKFGSSHKWSIIQGKNARGNDVLYGIDVENKCIWRYGYNGEDNLSEMQRIASFAKNNMQFLSSVINGEVVVKDTPAHLEGICSFANQKFREVGWTFRAWKSGVQEWTQPIFDVEHSFDVTTGNQPVSDLLDVNGLLYGTTVFGGTSLGGVLFSYDTATDTYAKLHDFVFGAPNSYYPESGVTLATTGINAGKLYGTTRAGGVGNIGSIYEWDIAGATFTKMIDLVAGTGSLPLGEMVEYNGKMYGMCSAGGLNGAGVIFEYDYNTNTYVDIFDFILADGTTPQGKLLLLGTTFYGMTSAGGVNNGGVLFSYDLTTYTILFSFDAPGIGANGTFPVQSVIHNNGFLYGTTQSGGLYGGGVLFSYNFPTYTVLYNFSQQVTLGIEPICTPILIGDYLYGTTRQGGAGLIGIIWRYNIVTNIYAKLYDFNLLNGSTPQGQMVLINNILYGLAQAGGSTNNGVLYSFNLAGIYDTGDVVQFGITGFEEFPAFWISLIDGNIGNEPDPRGNQWQIVLTTDNRYYNVYTLVYNELKDVFQPFKTPKPKIYCQYKNGYLRPRLAGDTGMMYEADRGIILTWDDDGSTVLTAPSHFDAVINEPKVIRKSYVALRFYSDIPPDRIEMTTTDHITYMDASDFETRENEHECEVYNDATVTAVGLNGAEPNPGGLNTLDTSKLFGHYAIVRVIMTQYNKVNTFITKVRWRSRTP